MYNKTSQFTQNKGILRKEVMRSVLLLNTVQILKSESSARGTSHNKHFSSAFTRFSLIVADQNENITLQERGEKEGIKIYTVSRTNLAVQVSHLTGKIRSQVLRCAYKQKQSI